MNNPSAHRFPERLEALVVAMKRELDLHKKLMQSGRDKQQALVKGDMPVIDRVTRDEEGLVMSVGDAAAQRMQLTLEVGRMLSLPEDQISITQIAHHVGEPGRSQLLSFGNELKGLVNDVVRVNRQNKSLTEQSLGFIRDFLMILGGGADPATTYTKRGVDKKISVSRVIIDRVA